MQGLQASKKKEQESEDHMLKLAEREEGRLTQEINKMQKDIKDLKEKENNYEVVWWISVKWYANACVLMWLMTRTVVNICSIETFSSIAFQ